MSADPPLVKILWIVCRGFEVKGGGGMTTLISNSEKTTWLSLHLQLCCVTSACHITSLSPGLLRVGGVASEPAGELVCDQHFPSS